MTTAASRTLDELLGDQGFRIVYRTRRPGRTRQVFPFDRLGLSPSALQLLSQAVPDGLYLHQIEGLTRTRGGADVAIVTPTASGKSLVFQLAALEALAQDPHRRILALYPLKALAREQEARWRQAFVAAGCDPEAVARIDGDTRTEERLQKIRRASVLLATPDVVHAWLLPNLAEGIIWRFLKALRLVIVDEVHIYSGVFGSNAAMLFRRLEHIGALAGTRCQYLVASATVRDPAAHLRSLFGRSFDIVDESMDTSGQHDIDVLMVELAPSDDLMTRLSALMSGIVRHTDHRFLAFVDSRKQTELLATIIKRDRNNPRAAGLDEPADGTDPEDGGDQAPAGTRKGVPVPGDWRELDVLPYRAGLEDADRAEIEHRLASGTLRGIISTSALELGIDIPHLNVGILVGVPQSSTSFYQRLGRIGRHGPGVVVIVNDRDFNSEIAFKHPDTILSLPLAESALYLENERIQYIHAMCLARPGGEHDIALAQAGLEAEDDDFSSPVTWPDGFLELCRKERVGETPPALQAMKVEAGDSPHLVFPLRDVDAQFSIELAAGFDRDRLGSVSYGQVMREAYPGAIYYYLTQPFRVTQVQVRQRVVKVRREPRHYITKPLGPISIVRPYLQSGEVFQARRWGDLVLLETRLQIQEVVEGYRERRGSKEVIERYPLPLSQGFFRQPSFTRYYYTTGVVLLHPGLSGDVEPLRLAERIYNAFLVVLPFERQDIHFAAGQLGSTPPRPLAPHTRFIAVYDQTYGSLRLSGRLADPEVLAQVAVTAAESLDIAHPLNPASAAWLRSLCHTLAGQQPEDIPELLSPEAALTQEPLDQYQVEVIMPGSLGLDMMRANEEFYVEAVFYNAVAGALYYRGRHRSTPTGDPTLTTMVPVTNVVPIEGESKLGIYNLADGTVMPKAGGTG